MTAPAHPGVDGSDAAFLRLVLVQLVPTLEPLRLLYPLALETVNHETNNVPAIPRERHANVSDCPLDGARPRNLRNKARRHGRPRALKALTGRGLASCICEGLKEEQTGSVRRATRFRGATDIQLNVKIEQLVLEDRLAAEVL